MNKLLWAYISLATALVLITTSLVTLNINKANAMSDYRDQVAQINDEKADLTNKTNTLQKGIEDFKILLDNETEQNNLMVSNLTSIINNLTTENYQLQNKIINDTNEIEDLNLSIILLTSNMSQKDSQITNLSNRLSSMIDFNRLINATRTYLSNQYTIIPVTYNNITYGYPTILSIDTTNANVRVDGMQVSNIIERVLYNGTTIGYWTVTAELDSSNIVRSCTFRQ